MNKSNIIGIGCAILFVGLWTVPLAEAFRALRCAQSYYADSSSIHSYSDLLEAREVLTCYSVSLLANLALSYILFRRSRLMLILPFDLAASAVIGAMAFHGSVLPAIPAGLSVAAIVIAAFIHLGSRWLEKSDARVNAAMNRREAF